MMMGNYHLMFARYHGLCGLSCRSWIWVMERYQCWPTRGNRPTTLVVDADRRSGQTCAEGSEQRGNLIPLNCAESLKLLQNAERREETNYGLEVQNESAHLTGQCESYPGWTGFSGKAEGEKGGCKAVGMKERCREWFLSILRPFRCVKSQTQWKAYTSVRLLLADYDWHLQTVDRRTTTQVGFFCVCFSTNLFAS